MTKRSSLSQALRHAGGKADPPKAPAIPAAQLVEASRVPSRRGKKTIAGFFDPAASRQLKQIALDEGLNVQDLLGEAINDLFEKRGKARIA
jgi:hypothetical protein